MNRDYYKQMMDQVVPSAALIRRTKSKMKREEPILIKRKISVTAAVVVIAVLMLSVSAVATLYFLKPSEVAEEFGDYTLRDAFESEGAVSINETVEAGGYHFTLLGVVSGNSLSERTYFSDGTAQNDRTYAVLAIQNADGTPFPDIVSDPVYQQTSFFVSPLVKGLKPWQVIAATMNGGNVEDTRDGVLYRLVE
jgi:non-homologous end joining protein Ku